MAKAGIGLLIFGLGFGMAKYLAPTKVITVEKEIQVEKRDVVTKTVRTKNVDGSSTTTRVTEDKTVIDTEKNKESVATNEKSNYKVDGLIGYDLRGKVPVYGVQVQKRFAGPIFIGVWGTTQQTGGLSVGIEF